MQEFMYLFKDQESIANKLSPDQMQKHMQEWMAWMQELSAQGKMKEGAPLEARGGKTISGRNKVVTDGPYPETKELVGGYIVVSVKDIDEAVELAKGCPGLAINQCSVEVRAIQSMEG